MKIGIVGAGKMGMDLFNWLVEYDHHITLVCKDAVKAEVIKMKMDKRLKRYLKRGIISSEEFEKKQSRYWVDNKIKSLEGCELVIEAITEDKLLKRKLFKEIQKVVPDNCILATNTSSIPLNEIFIMCEDRTTCLGVHFFYPIALNQFIELNETKGTKEAYIRVLEELFISMGKNVIRLKEENNFLITHLLTGIIGQIYTIYKEGYLSIAELEALIKKEVMLFGAFEIIDQTGIKIIVKALDNFKDSRYCGLNAPLSNTLKMMLEEDKTISLKAYEEEKLKKLEDKLEEDKFRIEAYKDEVILRVKAFVVNEFITAVNETGVDAKVLNKAMTSILGLNKSPVVLFEELTSVGLRRGMAINASKYRDRIWELSDYSKLIELGGCLYEE